MKAIYTLLILLIPFVGLGQENKSNLNSFINIQQIENNHKFSSQILTGKSIQFIGLATTIVGVATSTPEISYGGLGLSLVGLVVEIDSYKWLKKNRVNKFELLTNDVDLSNEKSSKIIENSNVYNFLTDNGETAQCIVLEDFKNGQVKVKKLSDGEELIINLSDLFILE